MVNQKTFQGEIFARNCSYFKIFLAHVKKLLYLCTRIVLIRTSRTDQKQHIHMETPAKNEQIITDYSGLSA